MPLAAPEEALVRRPFGVAGLNQKWGHLVSDISKRINALSPDERRALLARLLKEKQQPKPRLAPLSFAQERLYFLDQLYPDSSVYNIPMPVALPGPIHVDALNRSLVEIVRRHEVLRTTFSVVDNRPVQSISPIAAVDLPLVDLSALSEAAKRSEAERLSREDATRPFSLSTGPLFRASLVRLAGDEHLLLMNMHHIVSDGWSMGVFFREFWTLYQAFSHGLPSPLPEPSLQYADFAIKQRQHLQGEPLSALLSYWRERLAGAPGLLTLGVSKPRPAVLTFRGANLAFAVPPPLAEALRALSKQEGVTLFMTLVAAYSVLLQRYSQQDDIVIGTPIAGRNRADIEALIGFFVNTLVLRIDVSSDPTFIELMSQVRRVTLGGYEHQDLPFEKLVEDLQPDRNPAYAPLCQVVFAWQNMPNAGPGGELSAPPDETSDADAAADAKVPLGSSKFDLQVTMGEFGPAIAGSIEYNADLFERGDVRQLARSFRTLLSEVTTNPGRRISSFRLLTPEETGGIGPDDFPDVELTQKSFEDLIGAIRAIP